MNSRSNGVFLRGRFQAGFSLVELMVASVIGLLIMIAVLSLYLSMLKTNDEMAKTNAIAEAGRSAFQLMQRDLVHAGFWGEFIPDFDDLTFSETPEDYPKAVRDPCLAFSSWNADVIRDFIAAPVQMFTEENIPSACSSLLASRRAGSDFLVVRHAETCIPGEGACEAEKAGEVYFQASSCGEELDSTPYALGGSGLTLRGISCDSTKLADKRRFSSSIYYVRSYSVSAGDGIPALVRLRFAVHNGVPGFHSELAEVLVEGVELFRVELGVDNIGDGGYDILADDAGSPPRPKYTRALQWGSEPKKVSPQNRGDGSPDVFVRCKDSDDCDQHDFANAVAVKLHFLVRGLTESSGYTAVKDYRLDEAIPANSSLLDSGNFKRNVFSALVRLNNVSGRRETP